MGSAVRGKRGGILAASQEKTNYAGRENATPFDKKAAGGCQYARMHQNAPEYARIRSQKFFLCIGPGVLSGRPLDPGLAT